MSVDDTRKRILIVDDDPQIISLLQTILEGRGYCIRDAADGIEAARIMRDERLDAVVTDIFMPESDGFELLASIRAVDPSVPVIVISGSEVTPSVDFLHVAERLGAFSVLAKPFRSEQLLGMVEQALQLRATPS